MFLGLRWMVAGGPASCMTGSGPLLRDTTSCSERVSGAQVVETFPYEALSHAALAWLQQNLAACDVVHAHEWGGVFVDVITASAYRQLKPGPAWCLHVRMLACRRDVHDAACRKHKGGPRLWPATEHHGSSSSGGRPRSAPGEA